MCGQNTKKKTIVQKWINYLRLKSAKTNQNILQTLRLRLRPPCAALVNSETLVRDVQSLKHIF